MKIGFVLLTLLLSLYANEVLAAKKAVKAAPAKADAASKASSATKLTTDAQFGDQMVNGQYQMPFESVSTVENEKNIDALIGVRKNFDDRIEKTKSYRDTK
ncbi:MAG: hypothetical protein AABY64_03170 [Bdellovibrionota bacterium]